MNNKKKQASEQRQIAWAPLTAVIVAGLGCVATFFLVLARGLVALKLYTVANVQSFNQLIFLAAGIAVLGVAAYAIFEPDRIRRLFTGRQARYGSNAIIMIFAFLGILIVGNVLVYQQSQYKPMDWTEDLTNTLSPELAKELKALPEKVTATAFFSDPSSASAANELLNNIKANSAGKFSYTFINPDRDPQAAKKAGVTGDGKILLQMGRHKDIVPYASEQEILRGLLRLHYPGESVVYFLTGHGEHSIEQSDDSAMTKAKDTLEEKNYTVKTLNLVAENKIPEDAKVIVVAGPVKPVTDIEVKLIKDYLAQGGGLIVMEDPTPLVDFGDASDPLADMLVQDWGITISNDFVIDLEGPDPSVAVSAAYHSTNPITLSMNNVVTYFPSTRSLKVGNVPQDVTVDPLVQTTARAWGETDFTSLTQGGTQLGRDPVKEPWGPLTLAAAAEKAQPRARVVVFGTSYLAVNVIFDRYGNGDMFVNAVDWAAERQDQAQISLRQPTQRTFQPPSQFQWYAILVGSIFVIPGLIVLGGISTWIARRRQG